MKTFTLPFIGLLLALPFIAFAQRISTDSIEVRDDSALTIQMNVSKSADMTRDAIERYFNSKGINGKTHWGLTTYYAALEVPGNAERVNLYIRVKKETSESSVVFVAAGKDRKNLINLTNDKLAARAVQSFIEQLEKEIYEKTADQISQ